MTFSDSEKNAAAQLIHLALAEDLGVDGDLTAKAVIPIEANGAAAIVARKPGVLAGLPIVEMLTSRMGLTHRFASEDGTAMTAGTAVAHVSGSMRSLLSFERIALNFLQHLSGIATLTSHYVSQVQGTNAHIYDTRKTLPGWRLLEKYAVRRGGGKNHRIGLYDAVLIKDNHLAWLAHEADPIGRAIKNARSIAPAHTIIEIEVDDWNQYKQALACMPDIILLDNFDIPKLYEAVRLRDDDAPGIQLESSGGITIESVRARALTGIDRISVGALTHSAPALDIGLDFDQVLP